LLPVVCFPFCHVAISTINCLPGFTVMVIVICCWIQTHGRLQIIFTSYYKTSCFMFSLSVCRGFLEIRLSKVWRRVDWYTLLTFRRNLPPP
jgi:hypothetical protein